MWIVRHRERGEARWSFVGASGCTTRRSDARRFSSEAAAQAVCDDYARRVPDWDVGVLAVAE